MMDSQQLLVDYAKNGSETAFRELVSRYIDLVYSTAFRLVDGDSHRAQDVAQTVFMDLAQQALKLSGDAMLGGWLHRHTCFAAAKVLRGERRRQVRERQAVEMNALNATETRLTELAPVLDEVIDELGDEDRKAILLRFYERRDLRSVGEALGSSENAAQKRVTRALNQLHSMLTRRGIALSAAALGTALAGEAVTAAPAGLAASIAGTALASAAAGGGVTLLKILVMTKLKIGILSSAVIAGVAVSVLLLQHQTNQRLEAENGTLRQQSAQIQMLFQENQRLAEQLRVEAQRPQTDNRELLRLRGQVGLLRQAAQENPRLQADLDALTKKLQQTEAERGGEKGVSPEMQMLEQKSLLATVWGHAVLKFAEKNDGQMPSKLTAAAPYLNDNELLPSNWRNVDQISSQAATNGIVIDQFEIVYQGSLSNVQDRSRTILIREREPFHARDGRWTRAYVYANGFASVRWSDDGDFTAVEKEASSQQSPP